MDLGTINSKLNNRNNKSIDENLYEIGLVWDNCKLYNREDSSIYRIADKMEKLFQKKVKAFFISLSAYKFIKKR